MDYTIPPDHQVHLDQVYALAPPKLWHLPTELWEKIHARVTGKGVTACVLDTGMNSHPELREPVKAKSFISGQSWRDGNGHGTHVAGTLLGNDVGVAPEAKLMVGKVLSDQGSGGSPGIAAGIRWAVDEGADVISMSLGGGSPDTPTNEAIDYAFSKGAVVNVAAGNSGYNGSNTIGWPGRYPGCLCQASYQENGQISGFSSGGAEIDWACPGSNIISCRNTGGYVSMSGTSMATPFGSGLLCLIIELMRREGSPAWTGVKAVRAFLTQFCRDAGTPGKDVRFGQGIPRSEEMVAMLANDDVIWA